jgi:hypothetical protein
MTISPNSHPQKIYLKKIWWASPFFLIAEGWLDPACSNNRYWAINSRNTGSPSRISTGYAFPACILAGT